MVCILQVGNAVSDHRVHPFGEDIHVLVSCCSVGVHPTEKGNGDDITENKEQRCTQKEKDCLEEPVRSCGWYTQRSGCLYCVISY